MTDTQELLTKITALRQRLEQAQGLMHDAGTVAAGLLDDGDLAKTLRRRVAEGARQNGMIESTLRQFPALAGGDGASLPAQLTSRAGRLLRRAHELLGQLRAIADHAQFSTSNADPLAPLYRETASMTDTVLRTVQGFPEAPSAQIRMCEGLEAVLKVVGDRIGVMTAIVEQRRLEATRCSALADILAALRAGSSVESKELASLAESVQDDALQGKPMQFCDVTADDVPRHVATHSLAVAQVIARLLRHDSEWRDQPLDPIVAALVHDVGMAMMPADLLGQNGPLNDDQRRQIETHPILGADMAARIVPNTAWLVEAAGQHHERIDGTGYPAGLRELQIKPLIRLLSVCDVYAAMCQPRAYRPALDSRTALTDTLLLAEAGGLDGTQAERLLVLSFYPIGSVVELSDGALGFVVATHQGRHDLNSPARPVVALLTDSQGQILPALRHVDLSEVPDRSILRGLPDAERRERLGRRYLELV